MVPNVKQLITKWSNAKGKMSIKDIADPYIKANMAKMLEAQETVDTSYMSLLTEASPGSVSLNTMGGYTDGVAASDSYIFKPIALALVRRIFPDLIANKLCGVQAMSTPVGLAYVLRVLYNDGSANEAAWENVDYYGGYTGSQVGVSGLLRGNTSSTSANTGFGDTSGAGAFTSASEGWSISGTGGTWPMTAASTSTSGTTTTVLTPQTGFGAYPQLKVHIDQLAISAKERKLAASFSLESMQDLKAMHGLDIEKEMLNFIQYEVMAELDREILTAIKVSSIDTANGGAVISPIDLTGSGTGIDGRWSGEKYMNIIASIIHQANVVAIKTKRAPANNVVVSPDICSALQAAGHPFVGLNANVNATQVMSSVGKLNGSLDVYRDQYAHVSNAMVVLKGSGISDAGVIFSPYVMGLTNRAVDPTTFAPSIGVMARYAISSNLLGAGRYARMIPFYNMDKLIAGA
jgi:hypothetical protein